MADALPFVVGGGGFQLHPSQHLTQHHPHLGHGERRAQAATVAAAERPGEPVERLTRRRVGARLARDGIIPAMIDRIKELFQGESG